MQPTSPPVGAWSKTLALAHALPPLWGLARFSDRAPFLRYGKSRADNGMANGNQSWRAWLPICCRSLVFATSSTVDLHSPQIEGFFDAPWTTTPVPTLCRAVLDRPR